MRRALPAIAAALEDLAATAPGEVGVALVTGGQGHTNGAAALTTALAAECGYHSSREARRDSGSPASTIR